MVTVPSTIKGQLVFMYQQLKLAITMELAKSAGYCLLSSEGEVDLDIPLLSSSACREAKRGFNSTPSDITLCISAL